MYIAIGKIVQSYGTKGYLKAIPYSGVEDRFMDLKTIYVESEKGISGFIVEDVKIQNRVSLLKLKAIDTKESARMFVKCQLLLPEDQRIELPEDTYFFYELIGLEVFDNKGEYLGILEDILGNAANDIYVIRKEQQEILIPAVTEFIRKIDLQEKRIIVQLIEGMGG